MGDYKDPKTGALMAVTGEKFVFPTSGARLLLKTRPPVAKEIGTD